jgi:hypothetical protein
MRARERAQCDAGTDSKEPDRSREASMVLKEVCNADKDVSEANGSASHITWCRKAQKQQTVN